MWIWKSSTGNLQIALSDLNNRLDSQNRELNYQKENVVALEAELDKVRKQIVTAPVMAPAVLRPLQDPVQALRPLHRELPFMESLKASSRVG